MLLPSANIISIKDKCDSEIDKNGNIKFTILSYIDTLGCENCKLQLEGWKKYIEEVRNYKQSKVRFILYFNTHNIKHLKKLLARDNFNYPIYWDINDSLNKLNKLPHTFDFQTFLLDRHNKVIAIGNPITNTKIRKIYNKRIGIYKKNISKSLAIVNIKEIEFGVLNKRKTYLKKFHIYNKSKNQLEIYHIAKSCNCFSVNIGKRVIPPYQSTIATVSYKANKDTEFFESINFETNSKIEIPAIELHGIINLK